MLTIRSRACAAIAAVVLAFACSAPLVAPAQSLAQTHAQPAQTHA